jgi:hypothetical protein
VTLECSGQSPERAVSILDEMIAYLQDLSERSLAGDPGATATCAWIIGSATVLLAVLAMGPAVALALVRL